LHELDYIKYAPLSTAIVVLMVRHSRQRSEK